MDFPGEGLHGFFYWDLPQPLPVEGKEIAFVIEDGPLPQTTPLLLDALKKLGMKATFAVTGKNVEAYPDIARRIVADGHELANHTFSHPDLSGLKPEDLVREMRADEQAILRVTGVRPRYFRATDGELSASLRGEVQKKVLVFCFWFGHAANAKKKRTTTLAMGIIVRIESAG